jgi:hypothetical protein
MAPHAKQAPETSMTSVEASKNYPAAALEAYAEVHCNIFRAAAGQKIQ